MPDGLTVPSVCPGCGDEPAGRPCPVCGLDVEVTWTLEPRQLGSEVAGLVAGLMMLGVTLFLWRGPWWGAPDLGWGPWLLVASASCGFGGFAFLLLLFAPLALFAAFRRREWIATVPDGSAGATIEEEPGGPWRGSGWREQGQPLLSAIGPDLASLTHEFGDEGELPDRVGAGHRQWPEAEVLALLIGLAGRGVVELAVRRRVPWQVRPLPALVPHVEGRELVVARFDEVDDSVAALLRAAWLERRRDGRPVSFWHLVDRWSAILPEDHEDRVDPAASAAWQRLFLDHPDLARELCAVVWPDESGR